MAYQRDLETIIAELKKTRARLIWVTTCPVPNGFPQGREPGGQNKAPGRMAGVMQKHINPWALEVIRRYPEISVCDQWQFVKDNSDGVYTQWWAGKNVHFGGEPADALGGFLAEHVLNRMAAK